MSTQVQSELIDKSLREDIVNRLKNIDDNDFNIPSKELEPLLKIIQDSGLFHSLEIAESSIQKLLEKPKNENFIFDIFILIYEPLFKQWSQGDPNVGRYNNYEFYLCKLFNIIIYFTEEQQKKIIDIQYSSISEINKVYSNNRSKIDNISFFLQNINENVQTIENFEKIFKVHVLNLSNTEKKLIEQRTEFNFIGLADAFQKMKGDKQNELNKEQKYNGRLMGGIGLLLVVKLLYALFGSFSGFDAKFTFISLSSIFLIAVLIYFFRISLMNIKSIKSQILQLDLRLSLCQFIHNYAEDSEKMRSENMKDSLDRFESIIFSPIVANEEQIPTTFDNLDQFIKVMNLVNGAKSGNNQTNENKQN